MAHNNWGNMGAFDSSKTRVAPIFDALLAKDGSGGSWLDRLIALGSRKDVTTSGVRGQHLTHPGKRCWGSDEVMLPAPAALLEYLVTHIDIEQVEASTDIGETRAKRTALANRDPQVIAEAMQALASGQRGRKWFVLEGESRPDAFLEAEQLVICIEGKRTEARCTSHTTWMRRRSQLLRHMDAAREAYPDKRVMGLLIVEGIGEGKTLAPSQHWLDECAAQYADTMLAGSLPHRNKAEREKLQEGVLGVTTWQAVCEKNGLSWPPSFD
jgi:hypothetical protein